jgi:hypothetical protein
MAQTRATSKALSGPLRFVMTLAGYEATPADEMPHDEPAPAQPQVPPFGHPFDKAQMGALVGAACTQLCGGNRDLGRALFNAVTADCGGYMPTAAALAIVHCAEGANRVPDVEAPEVA